MRKDTALTEFMSWYLSQDSDEIHPDPWTRIQIYANLEGPVDEVAEAAAEARELVAQHLPSGELYERLFSDHGMYYLPASAGYEANDWLTQVADVLESSAARRRAQA